MNRLTGPLISATDNVDLPVKTKLIIVGSILLVGIILIVISDWWKNRK